MRFDLKAPCSSCSFRRDVPGFLHKQRAREICNAILAQDQTFACHKTVMVSGEYELLDPDGEFESDEIILGDVCEEKQPKEVQHCAGALILAEKMQRPNQLTRIAERLGMYDHRELRMTAPVFDTPREMVAHHGVNRRNGKVL